MFKLPAELTISQVQACKNQLLELIDESDEIYLDDSDVVRIDTLGVQLLLASVHYIASKNKVLHWQSTSSVIIKSIEQLGLDDAILNKYFVTQI